MKKIYSFFLVIAFAMFGFVGAANAATIAQFIASADETNATTLNDVTVVYQNGWSTWVQDATGSLLVYGDLGATASNGDVVSNLSGVYTVYGDIKEMKSPSGATVTSGSAVTAPTTALSAITIANISKYVSISGTVVAEATLEEDSEVSFDITDGTTTAKIFTKFKDIDMVLSANETVTIVGVISAHKGVPQVFPISITKEGTTTDPDTGSDPDTSSESTIAQFIASADETNATTLNDVTVVYQNGWSTWVQDATGSLLVYGDLGATVSNGDVVSNLSGVYTVYGEIKEMKSPSGATVTSGSSVTAPTTALSAITIANISKYVSISGTVVAEATLEEDSEVSFDITDGTTTVQIFTKFKDIDMVLSANETVTIVGVISAHKGVPQVFPISITKEGTTTDPDTGSDPDTSSKSTIAQFIASADETNATTLNDVTVTFQNGWYTWVQDATGSLLIYGELGDLSNGDILSGLSGTYDIYFDTHEMTDPTGLIVTSGSSVMAPTTSLSDITIANINKYVAISGTVTEDATLEEGVSGYVSITDGTTTIEVYTKFQDIDMSLSAGDVVTIIGLVSSFKSEPQVYAISISENESTNIENTPIASSIYSNAGVVYVESETGAAINMYSIDGRSIYSSVANSTLTAIDAKNAQIVIVTVDGVAAKVAVK